RRQAAAGAGTRHTGAGHSGRTVIEWVRRRRRAREIAHAADHERRKRAGPLCLSPLALRARPPGPSLCGRAGERGLPLLLLPPLSVRRRRVGPATPDERPAPPDAGPGRGLRSQTWLGTARALRAGQALAAGGRRSGPLRLDPTAMGRV